MLVSPLNPKLVTTIDSVVVTYLGSILFNFLSSKYITKPYRKCYNKLIKELSI